MFCLKFVIFQNFLRNQKSKMNYNLVSKTLMFLDCICGSTTGGLGLLGLYINEHNVSLINQTLQTLTEYCQGPCHENQNCIGECHSYFHFRFIKATPKEQHCFMKLHYMTKVPNSSKDI